MRRFWPLTAGAALMFALILLPNLWGREINDLTLWLPPGSDKALHLVEYTIVYLVLCRLAQSSELSGGSPEIAALVGGTAIAILDEVLQQWGRARNVEMMDLAANVSGLALGWGAGGPVGRLKVAVGILGLVCGAVITTDTYLKTRDFAQGQRFERVHDFHTARIHYRRAIERGMRTPSLYNSLSWVELESGEGDPKEAVELAEIALSMRPDDPDIFDTFGWALHHVGHHQEALKWLERAFAVKPKMYCIHYHLGAVYLALGRRDLAVSHFRLQQSEFPTARETVMAARALGTLGALQ